MTGCACKPSCAVRTPPMEILPFRTLHCSYPQTEPYFTVKPLTVPIPVVMDAFVIVRFSHAPV